MNNQGLVIFLLLLNALIPISGLFSAEINNQFSVNTELPIDASLGIQLPDGFEATIFADIEGYGRHLAVRDDGTVYFALTVRLGRGSNMGIVAMRDTNDDGIADHIERFATQIGVGGFPEQRLHEAKTFAIDDKNNIYVNVGAPSNACMEEFRTRGSPGQMPCPQIKWQSGIWRVDADRVNQQQQTHGSLYATGIRNAMAMKWNDVHKQLFFLTHGRDALFTLFPEYYSPEESAELPSEEMHVLRENGHYGWPFTYYDHHQNKRVLAPEYGGDGLEGVQEGIYEEPVAVFPAHWAPNDIMF